MCVAEGSASRMYLDGVLKTIGGNKIRQVQILQIFTLEVGVVQLGL